MSGIGARERETQSRVIALFQKELGYRYLGDWSDRDNNSNIEELLLTDWLGKCGYTSAQISAALHKLRTEAGNNNRGLYGNNEAVYNLLRYGVSVKTQANKVNETVHLINWNEPEKNDFVIVEEVTLRGNHERRPDLVLYINGIAIGVALYEGVSVDFIEFEGEGIPGYSGGPILNNKGEVVALMREAWNKRGVKAGAAEVLVNRGFSIEPAMLSKEIYYPTTPQANTNTLSTNTISIRLESK